MIKQEKENSHEMVQIRSWKFCYDWKRAEDSLEYPLFTFLVDALCFDFFHLLTYSIARLEYVSLFFPDV